MRLLTCLGAVIEEPDQTYLAETDTDGAARSDFEPLVPQRTFRAPPDCSPVNRTGTTVDFSSSRKGIDNSAGAAILLRP
jgi:hypothetical protein